MQFQSIYVKTCTLHVIFCYGNMWLNAIAVKHFESHLSGHFERPIWRDIIFSEPIFCFSKNDDPEYDPLNMIQLDHMKGVVGLSDEAGSWFCYLALSNLVSSQLFPWQGILQIHLPDPERMSRMITHLTNCPLARFGYGLVHWKYSLWGTYINKNTLRVMSHLSILRYIRGPCGKFRDAASGAEHLQIGPDLMSLIASKHCAAVTNPLSSEH